MQRMEMLEMRSVQVELPKRGTNRAPIIRNFPNTARDWLCLFTATAREPCRGNVTGRFPHLIPRYRINDF